MNLSQTLPLILVLLPFSCVKNTEVLPEEELSVEEQKWRDQNLKSYEFTLQISCFCIREYTLPKRLQPGWQRALDGAQALIDQVAGEIDVRAFLELIKSIITRDQMVFPCNQL